MSQINRTTTAATDNSKAEARAAWMSLALGLALLIVKFTAYFLTGSSAVFSDALESIVNVFASAMTVYSIGLAHAPADVKIIPGHGNLASRDDMVKMLAVLKDTRAAVQAGINQGKSLEQLKQEKAFAKWDYLNESHHIRSDVYFERLYKTLSAQKPPATSGSNTN